MNGLCRLLALLLVFTAALHAEKTQLHTRTFKVPPDFLVVRGGASGGAAPAAPADPFSDRVPSTPGPERLTAKAILEAQGITFPEGATATFNPTTGLLIVTNSQSNLDLVEIIVNATNDDTPSTIAFIVTVIEGPGELIRQGNAAASQTANAAKELATLLGYAKNPDSNVRVVGDAFIEAKSGNRVTTESVREHIYASDLEMDAKSRSSVIQEMRPVGLRLEIEPTVGADGITLDTTLSLELHPGPPHERQINVSEPITGNPAGFSTTEVSGAHFTTSITSASGATKLIGLTKPVGTAKEKDDILWAAFITGTVRRLEALPGPKPPQPSVPLKTPPGMAYAGFHAPDGLFETLMEPPYQPLRSWLIAQGLTFPEGAFMEHKNGVLHFINTPTNLEAVCALIGQAESMAPKTVAFTLHTVQAPAILLRGLTHSSAATSDHADLLAAVEAAVARGEAMFINSIFLETKPGTRATHESVREHFYLSEFGTDAKGLPHLAFETRKVGTIFEVEPTVGADGRTVEISFAHKLHPAPPEARRDHFLDPASKKSFDMPVVDFHSTKTVAGITLTKGSTKLISLIKPTGHVDAEVLWATFLHCDVVAQVAKSLNKAGSSQFSATKPNSQSSEEMYVRKFRTPPDFLSARSLDTSIPPDKSGLQPHKKMEVVLKELFDEHGVSFPEGSYLRPRNDISGFIARNTQVNLDLIDTAVAQLLAEWAKTVVFTTHVLQGPGPLLRHLTAQAASKSNHHTELDELLAAVKAGTVQHLNTARIETKSGTRATAEQVTEHIAIADVSVNDKGEPVFEQEMRQVGLRVELEAIIGADGHLVDLNIAPEFHAAAPFEHREHVIDTQGRRLDFPLTDYHVAKVTTCITMPDGTVRLLSLYKPTGKPEFEKEDILQAIFITCDILRTGE